MRDWSAADYRERIYNADYIKTDREFDGTRARNLAPLIIEQLHAAGCHRVLDYGGGPGYLTDLLREAGFEADCFDPFGRQDAAGPEKYDCVLAVEVLEHEIDAPAIWRKILAGLRAGGLFLATTEFCDGKDLERWFYANPRAGHTLLYSRAAFHYMAIRHGLDYRGDVRENIHLLWNMKGKP